MKREGKVVLAFIVSLWIAIPLYIILHEGGHALIASLYGAKIIEFNIMEGYVITEGGIFNEITYALFYVASMLTPVTIFTIYLMLYQSNTDRDFYRVFSAVFAGTILFSIGVWIIVPIQYMVGIANPNDDVVKFIAAIKVNPLTVTVLVSLLMSIYIWAVWKKNIFQNGYRVLKLDRSVEKHKSDYEIDYE